ncbi:MULTISPECIES: hypothetical protein [unclassified Frigoribacterium]|uniref:hypothetical protein n=1 Tax=unclassified Frigoribacterium TaxID=2627005 RepID=UPI0006FACFA0|nr:MULTISPECIES: hypothetical protein [unclassified Frigoribacterium]KQO81520.1 hypothetical protein ASF17_10090 [Frigoribacterium sp. Leaf263]KQR65831.1 hypothetical protein ASF89_01190 [Frigoribacterium sp. Leaf172]
MTSPIFDQILSQREATPLFESISGSFPSVVRDDVAIVPSTPRGRTDSARPARRPGSTAPSRGRTAASGPRSLPATTWPLGPVA